MQAASRQLLILFGLFACLLSAPAQAQVTISFHSFNGSIFFGRYPHTFVVFEGTLDETGVVVNENYGFTAKRAGPAALSGPVEHEVDTEKPKYIGSTNRHFTIPISDQTFRDMKSEIARWRDAPGKFYDLDSRNCIHFVGKLGQMAGLRIEYPRKMLRKPRAWLNHIGRLNPRLGAIIFD